MDFRFYFLGLALPFIGSLLLTLLPDRSQRWFGPIVLAQSLGVFAIAVHLWPNVAQDAVHVFDSPWMPSLNLTLSFQADRLGIFFMAIVGLIGAAIAQYSREYFKNEDSRRFWLLFSIFQGAMLGIPLSNSLVVLFVFWEMTTLTSALLIALHDHDGKARRAAVQAFMVTGFGGLCLLAGILLLGQIAGTYKLTELAELAPLIISQDTHQIALGLMLVGAFTKSAQFPFHFWLPGAMAAPTPISAYLHSATMVKAGIILMSRMFPIFSSSPLWAPVLGTVGMITFVLASWNAFRATDMKKILAYSTVSYLGVLTTIYGYSHGRVVQGELLHIANHTFYKSALFLLLGWFEKVSGTRDLNILDKEDWYHRQPLGFILFIIAGLAVVGGPFLLGYTSKAVFFDIVFATRYTFWTPLAIFVGSCLTVAFTIKLIGASFWGKDDPSERSESATQKVSAWFIVIPSLLLLPQVLGGVFPDVVLDFLSEPAHEIPGGIAFWQSLDAKNLLKFSILLVGLGLYFFWRALDRVQIHSGFESVVIKSASAFLRLSSRLSAWSQSGSLGTQVGIILLSVLAFVMALVPWAQNSVRIQPISVDWMYSYLFTIPALMIVAGSIALLFAQSRVGLLLFAALSSYGLALHFVLARAPDLALTQFLADTVGLILILLVFTRTSGSSVLLFPVPRKAFAMVCSISVGLAAGAIVWLSSLQSLPIRVGHSHLRLSVPEGFGSNVVNVILVDFRAADTLGEVVVLVIAAVGALALLPQLKPSPKVEENPANTRSLLVSYAVSIILPLTFIFAVYLLLRGHNEPGGGFIAALVTVVAIVLHGISFRTKETYSRLGGYAEWMMWGGFLVCIASGLLALFKQAPFLTHYYQGSLSTALVFDVGVYLTVLGTAVTTLRVFGEKAR